MLAASEGSTAQQYASSAVADAGGAATAAATGPLPPLVFDSDVAVALFTDRLTSPPQVASLCADVAGFGCWRAFFLYTNGKLKNVSHSGFNLAALGAASVAVADSPEANAAADAAAIAKEVAAHFASALPAPTSHRSGATGGDFRVLQASVQLMTVPAVLF